MDRLVSCFPACLGAALALLVVACPPLPAHATDGAGRDSASVYPAGCSPAQARAIFAGIVRQLRAEHRHAITLLADELEQELESATPEHETPEMLAAARQSLAGLRAASDAKTAIELILQYRSRWSTARQKQATAMSERLHGLVEELQRAKLAYQPYLAAELRARWDLLDAEEKRALLGQYFALGGDAPEWLMRHGPGRPLPLPRTTAELFQPFEGRASDHLRTAEKAFQPQRDRLVVRVQAARRQADPSETGPALEELHELLVADYGKGFRGMMLLEADAELPTQLREQVAAVARAFRGELARLRSERDSELAELSRALAPLRQEHLERAEFGELMAIDIRLQELRQLLRPIRILARREASIDWPEDVLLTDVRDQSYHVRFLRDQREEWLGREQVLLKPAAETLRSGLSPAPPADGPGIPLTARIAVHDGQTLMGYRHMSWYPATVVDVSPLGVVISWQGFGPDNTQLEPRTHLRLVDE